MNAIRAEWPMVVVEGSAYDMGYQHGARAKELVEKYLLWIDRLTGTSRDVLCRNAMAFLPLMERLSSACSFVSAATGPTVQMELYQ